MQSPRAHGALRHLNAFIAGPSLLKPSSVSPATSGPLAGLSIAIKDNICTTDFPTTCGSRGLHGYQSPYDATVVSLLRQAGGHIGGKTNLDEFGMGSHSTHSAYGAVVSAAGRSAGGSSGGSAVVVATDQCHGALGTDTGGSVRLPAAYNDIYGFKPSYGLVSRWGVVAYANSLDTVGYMAKNVKTLRLLHHELGSLEAHDEKDPTSLNLATRKRIRKTIGTQKRPRQSIRFGVPTEYNIEELSPIVREVWLETLQRLQAAGHTIHPVSLPLTRQALSAYYVLAPAEASSNLAKYDGVRYGSHPPDATLDTHTQLFAKTRKHGFGEEVRRRILLGAYSLSADAIDNYFMQAQRIRRLVVKDFDAVFAMPNVLTSEASSSRAEEADTADAETTIDAIICPTAPTLAPTLEEVARQAPLDAYAGDVFTVPASLAGLPAISIPVIPNQTTSMPPGVQSVGMQIITQYGDDEACLDYAALLSSLA